MAGSEKKKAAAAIVVIAATSSSTKLEFLVSGSDGKVKMSLLIMNKVPRPLTSIWMLLGFVSSHDKFGERSIDEFGDGADGGKSEFSSVAYPFRTMILDGEICYIFK
ncbi:hypothetical protein EJB05_56650, partial [Eragrostis curvula]